jgi:tripartite-type tricarboxylate transporter receptor subunit TctC
VDNLVALEIEKTWDRVEVPSFDDGAPRITAMLRGDAQIDIAISDFTDQIQAGKLKLISVFSDKRIPDQAV